MCSIEFEFLSTVCLDLWKFVCALGRFIEWMLRVSLALESQRGPLRLGREWRGEKRGLTDI